MVFPRIWYKVLCSSKCAFNRHMFTLKSFLIHETGNREYGWCVGIGYLKVTFRCQVSN